MTPTKANRYWLNNNGRKAMVHAEGCSFIKLRGNDVNWTSFASSEAAFSAAEATDYKKWRGCHTCGMFSRRNASRYYRKQNSN